MIDLAIDTRIFINTDIEEAVQELDLIFNTERTELIGYPEFGTNFEQFLWSLNPDPNKLKEYINNQIVMHSLFLREMNVDIDVQIYEGNYRNIYLVGISISDQYGHSEQRSYEFK